MQNSAVMGDDTITRVLVESSEVTSFAFRASTLSCGFLLQDGSALDRDRCPIVAGLVRMDTESECHVATFRSLGNILRVYRSIKGVPRSTSTVKFLTIPSPTLTCELPICTKRRMFPIRQVGFSIALPDFGV